MVFKIVKKFAIKASILFVLLSQTSCISPFLSGFGKEKIYVSANEPGVMVSSAATPKSKIINEGTSKIKVSKFGDGDIVTAKKAGFQTEQLSVTPSVKKKYYRTIDIVFSTGVGLACIVAYTTKGSPEIVQ